MNGTTEVAFDVLATLTPSELRKIDAYWRACNYLAAAMIYLRANPLLRGAFEAGAHQASTSWSLGIGPRTVVDLGPPKQAHQKIRPECHVHRRARSRCASNACELLP